MVSLHRGLGVGKPDHVVGLLNHIIGDGSLYDFMLNPGKKSARKKSFKIINKNYD